MNHYYAEVADMLSKKGHLSRTTIISGPHTGSESVTSDDGMTLTKGIMEGACIHETITLFPHLFIYGGGHVALALYRMARVAGWEVDVFDERPEWGSRERFPEANVHSGTLGEMLTPLKDPASYAVIMTHKYDKECLSYALKQPFCYIGMIGSSTKTQIAFNQMRSEGFTQKELEKVHAPIGLAIGGDTPAEIAVSIMAQIILHYTGGKKHHMVTDLSILQEAGKDEEGVLVRVLANKGSSPASAGAMMVVRSDGSFAGTIGGGMIEHVAIKTAKTLKRNLVGEYDLSEQGELDMICGGKAQLLYTLLKSKSSLTEA